ncbi:MAG: UDP-N-acetylmuramoyl-L-alanine--D-glutamate ligase [Synergistaceae bacterium]|nr:UDP-N-acetylmuramoyl-L-alanine--D-glutamate ligase [Synergistaceae bacterium]
MEVEKGVGNRQELPSWRGKRLTVIGAGVSGRELALLGAHLGADVFVSERGKISDDVRALFEGHGIAWEAEGHTEKAFLGADAFILSSGIPPKAEVILEARRRGIPLIGELDFVAPFLSGLQIGVTGSNGKSTVTSLIGHTLARAGRKVGTGGNLGTAAASFAQGGLDAVVLELSSFQLTWATQLHLSIAVVTNLAPDHIDWHGSYEAYVAAKAKILALRAPDGWAIVQDRDVDALEAKDAERVIALSWGQGPKHETAGRISMGAEEATLILPTRTRLLFRYAETSLLGDHNLENVAMALAAMDLLHVDVPAATLLEGFSPLPHRCEDAGILDDVLYVDDSKGTNVAASVTAMTSLKGRKVVILGGRGKGEDYALLAETVAREADAAVVMGEEASAIARALDGVGYAAVHEAKDMAEAVALARGAARPGMMVLLSPACTSWDMYDDYGQRGDHFRAIVRGLREGT